MIFRRLTPLVLLILPLAPHLASQAPCATSTILVNVLDQRSRPVRGLGAKSFRAKYHGRPVDIVSVTPDASSRRIVLLLDASGSMQDKWKLKAEQMLAADLVRQGAEHNSFALMVFSSRIQDEATFAQGFDVLAKKVKDLPSTFETVPMGERKTAIFDTIGAALDELKPPHSGDVVYILTDGGDNKSVSQASAVERRLLEAGVRVFAFVLLNDSTRRRTPEEESGLQSMSELSKHTGGLMGAFQDVFSTPHGLSERALAQIIGSARLLYPIMDRTYRVEIRTPPDIDKPRSWSLEVVEGKSHYEVTYPRLAPCDAAQPKG